MGVREVQAVLHDHLGQSVGRAQLWVGLLEQSIGVAADLMKIRPAPQQTLSRAQPERNRIAHEMDLMPGLRHLQSEFGGDHARAARTRMTEHTDFHVRSTEAKQTEARRIKARRKPQNRRLGIGFGV